MIASIRPFARVLVDESHRPAWSTRSEVAAAMNPAHPADAGYVQAAQTARTAGFAVAVHQSGPITAQVLADTDVLVLPHSSTDDWEATTGAGEPAYSPAEQQAIVRWVEEGGALLLFGETEQRKYANSVEELAARFGVLIANVTVQDPAHSFREVPTWVLGQATGAEAAWGDDLLAGVGQTCWYRAGALEVVEGAEAVIALRASEAARPAEAGLLALVRCGAGRVVVLADSDLFGDDSIDDLGNRALWANVVTWLAAGRRSTQAAPRAIDPAWDRLSGAVESLRPLQRADGSIDKADREAARVHLTEVIASIEAMLPRFAHQREHLEATRVDLQRWIDEGLGVPDFLDSLRAFAPERDRRHGVEHLAVFPMYTQNGNPNRNLEAVITRIVWPAWIEEVERTAYQNPAFLPIEFVAFTSGYDTHSAVFFPETVATREVARFTWGGIFCDREAARFRRVTQAAAERLRLALPPQVRLLISDQQLAQETFVLWDLVHDRTHSHGDLPFDPFMIKQRMPYWMYALEELRCDLTAYREMSGIDVPLAPYVRHAVLFDRLFRFPTTGERVRNYDGLGGQIIFAWLHSEGVLRWTDNTLTIDWMRLDKSMAALCDRVDQLYRAGIDRSRVAHWMAAHEFIDALVPAHPASAWSGAGRGLDLQAEPKVLIDAVLPDEFPLNIFYEALRRELTPVIASTAGITGSTDVTASAA